MDGPRYELPVFWWEIGPDSNPADAENVVARINQYCGHYINQICTISPLRERFNRELGLTTSMNRTDPRRVLDVYNQVEHEILAVLAAESRLTFDDFEKLAFTIGAAANAADNLPPKESMVAIQYLRDRCDKLLLVVLLRLLDLELWGFPVSLKVKHRPDPVVASEATFISLN